MNINEAMIRHYIQYVNMRINGGEIVNIEIKGDVIQFTSHSNCRNYHDSHEIDLIDVMSFIWNIAVNAAYGPTTNKETH